MELDCPYHFTSRWTMGRCDCVPKKVKPPEEPEDIAKLVREIVDMALNQGCRANEIAQKFNITRKK